MGEQAFNVPATNRLAAGFARYRSLARHPEARLLIGAALASEIGDWFAIVAVIALADRFGEGALSVGVMLALRTVPRLLFQIPAGAMVDRVGHSPRLLVAVQLAMAVLAASFALLAVVPELWLLYALVFALESINTVAWPAFRTQVVGRVPEDERGAANGALGLCATVGALTGPLLGAGLLAWSGPTVVFLVNGLTFAAIAWVLNRVPRLVRPVAPEHAAAPALSYRWLLARRDLLAYAALQGAAVVMIQATIALFVVRAKDLDLGEYGTGVFYSSVGVGALAGGLIAGLGRHHDRRAIAVVGAALAGLAATLIGFGWAPSVGVAVAALVAAGLTSEIGEVAALTYFHHRLPDQLYGRFLSIFVVVLSLGAVTGLMVGPLLADRIGIPGALALLAIPVAALAVIAPLLAAQPDDPVPLPNQD